MGMLVPTSGTSQRETLQMIFFLFAVLIAAAFFVSSIFLLNYGRQLGLRYLQKDAGTMTGLTTVEGALFALMGLLLAFTISWIWYGRCQIAQLDSHAHFCHDADGRALHAHRHGISAARTHSH